MVGADTYRLTAHDALALLDDHKGYYPYVMRWDWVTSATRDGRGRALERGLQHLLDAYRAHGGADVTPDQIRLYELHLLASWYHDAVAERGYESAAAERDRLRGLLQRLR